MFKSKNTSKYTRKKYCYELIYLSTYPAYGTKKKKVIASCLAAWDGRIYPLPSFFLKK